ncbi:hypothetical protein [Ruficoccus sp. ZRK36]|uniref:hypothetical protein n=1 Tax=Ruficoccus sp. ZRK36 TaxID=2866311 RepID=UPI001C738F1D|nr:hypothetical protein [Ruficoccus sp. ZRK36]QYY36761.1 hypothetical protein K0V07_04615 [Ruficoccus sp. ZRK36]
MRKIFSLPLAAAALFTLSSTASADVLVFYTDDTTQTPINNEYTINPIAPHAPFQYSASKSWWSRATDSGFPVNPAPSGTIAEKQTATVTANSYVEFGLNAVEGYQISIDQVDILVQPQSLTGTDAPATEPMTLTVFLRSSLDNYESTLAVISSSIPGREVGGAVVTNPVTLTADALPTEFNTISGTVNFRAYAYIETEESSFYQVARLDNIEINGTTSAIPESATVGLFGGVFALAVLLLARRRR